MILKITEKLWLHAMEMYLDSVHMEKTNVPGWMSELPWWNHIFSLQNLKNCLHEKQNTGSAERVARLAG